MKYKALFIHIPKAGGSSIGKAPFITKHGSPEFDPAIPVNDLGLKCSFAFTRNPYDRFTSAVFHHDYCKPEDFTQWFFHEFMEGYREKFSGELKDLASDWAELQPQWRHVYHKDEKGKLKKVVELVGKLENIDLEWKQLCRILGEDHPLTHENKNKFPDHKKYMTDEIKKELAKVYARDFELFGYEK